MTEPDFALLFKQYYRRLFLYAYGFVMDEMEAEDIVQEAFSTLWIRRQYPSYSQPANMEAYLYASVKHACLKYFRKLKVMDNYRIKQAEALLLSMNEEDVVEEDSEVAEAIRRAMQQLTPQQARIVNLYITEGKRYSEIAALLQLSENTIKTHLKRAYRILRVNLDKTTLGLAVFLLLP